MKLINDKITIKTTPKELNDITQMVIKNVSTANIKEGLCSLYIQHTSASLIIQENADPAVLRDIESFFKRIVPEDPSVYEHDTEGPDDMPAHIRSLLTNTSLSIPIENSKLVLGTWQAIYLYEHRSHAFERRVHLNIIGN
ncbi:MAG: secondary thiamine-phosphate synthase enzyme YjbQ [Pseudomonadota bacterium]|nr:secondary thiamine-phosphate synthase enzyme YjbQ [Pseudomonadota bacterium]